MAQIRIRIFHEELVDMLVESNPKLMEKMTQNAMVEVWDESEGDSRPLITMEGGDYLEIVYE